MLLFFAAIVLGFVILAWSADKFVIGASALARNLGVAPMIIGMTILGFGTSAPEMLVSGMAAWEGNTALGVGNALGSNITNIALVLGITALVAPMVVHSRTLQREFPALFVVTAMAGMVLYDAELSRFDGIFLLLGVGGMLYWLLRIARADKNVDPLEGEFSDEIPTGMPNPRAIMWLVLGLLLLLVSSKLLVWGAVNVAQALGVSDLVIGLTIVAVGTSLPELAATLASALKKEHEMAIGNVIGSNMFNLLAVLGLPGLIHPAVLDEAVMSRDFVVMVILTVGLFLMAYGFRGEGKINRIEGAGLVLAYVAYLVILYFTAVG